MGSHRKIQGGDGIKLGSPETESDGGPARNRVTRNRVMGGPGIHSLEGVGKNLFLFSFFLSFLIAFSRAAPSPYGGSQARGLIGAVASDLRQGHSNAGSEPCLQPTPQLTATPGP